MNGTLRLLKITGIPVRVHWSFGILFLAIILWGWKSGLSIPQICLACFLIIVLFVCVVLHELGHAKMADYYHIRTHDIIILPIGGIARLDRLPDRPINEFFVALAGPAVNLTIAIVVMLVLMAFFGAPPVYLLQSITDIRPINSVYGFLMNLWQANVLLAAFNMIPAFPLDGGRVFRSLLSMRLGRLRATRIASFTGQLFAVAIFMHGLWLGDVVEIVIAVFVYFTAASEVRSVNTDFLLSQYRVADIMRPEFTRIRVSDNLGEAFDSLKRGMESSFLVFFDTSELAGILDEEAITKAWEDGRLGDTADKHLNTAFITVQPDDPILKIYGLMQQNNYSILPVEVNGEITGVVDDKAMEALIRLVKVSKGGSLKSNSLRV